MMKVGVDGRKLPGAAERSAVESMRKAHEIGMEGIFFRTLLDVTPTLDRGVLRELREEAGSCSACTSRWAWRR